MEVDAHDAAAEPADPLRVAGVLQRVEADEAEAGLGVEVVGSEAGGHEVAVHRVPAEAGHLQLLRPGLAQAEPPQRQQAPLRVLELELQTKVNRRFAKISKSQRRLDPKVSKCEIGTPMQRS